MTARLDLTGTGLIVRDEDGTFVLALTWIPGVGEGVLAVSRRGAPPLDVPLDLDGLKHLRAVAEEAHVNAVLAAATAGQEPRVPRRPAGSDLPG